MNAKKLELMDHTLSLEEFKKLLNEYNDYIGDLIQYFTQYLIEDNSKDLRFEKFKYVYEKMLVNNKDKLYENICYLLSFSNCPNRFVRYVFEDDDFISYLENFHVMYSVLQSAMYHAKTNPLRLEKLLEKLGDKHFLKNLISEYILRNPESKEWLDKYL